jgi:hypothetical protein
MMVLNRRADTMAWEHDRLLAQAASLRSCLLAFNHAIANRGVLLTPMTERVLGNSISELARVLDTSPWQRAAETLKADPMAEINIALPDPRPGRAVAARR